MYKLKSKELKGNFGSRAEWRFRENSLLVILCLYLLIVQTCCQTILDDSSHTESSTKSDLNIVHSKLNNHCHNCHPSISVKDNVDVNNGKNASETDEDLQTKSDNEDISIFNTLANTVVNYTIHSLFSNRTDQQIEGTVEHFIDNLLDSSRYEIMDGVEIKRDNNNDTLESETKHDDSEREGRSLFKSYSYEYRILQKIKNFINSHIISINLPKAADAVGFRSFGLKKLLLPVVIGIQIIKTMLFAMFLPSILGSFGKILGKGLSTLSAASSQASYPPANGDDLIAYNNDNKDFAAEDSDTAGAYNIAQDTVYPGADHSDLNGLGGMDISKYGAGGQKVSYLPTKNGYYKNQLATTNNHYKVFQKIPASSMILNNYDPFYSPLLSRLDGIFARLGLTPSENSIDSMQIGGQTLSDVKLESCREQLICLMYSTPAKYAPYSNLVSAQLSRELNELRRPVSDNPEILRFFRYMRAARRGQEGADCMRVFPGCSTPTTPTHTMIAAYHDINKLVTARKLQN